MHVETTEMKDGLTTRHACPWCGDPKGIDLCRVEYQDAELAGFLRTFYERQGVFEREWLSQAYYRLKQCTTCGVVYQLDVPNDLFSERLYSRWIDPVRSFAAFDARKSIGYYEARAAQIVSLVKWLGKDPCDLRVLDYSMGWGQWARIGAALGVRMFGTEFTEAKRDHGRRLGISMMAEEQLAGTFFDCVHADQVLEHVSCPRALLEMLCKLVRPGGLITISVPYGDDVQRRTRKLDWGADKHSPFSLMPVQPLEHINCFNRRSLLQGLAANGFDEICLHPQNHLRRVLTQSKKFAGAVTRKILKKERPPITIDIVAVNRRS
jgi:SAM-dependent methyltransferase